MKEKRLGKTLGKLKITREAERRFFFYATIFMFILYGFTRLSGG